MSISRLRVAVGSLLELELELGCARLRALVSVSEPQLGVLVHTLCSVP